MGFLKTPSSSAIPIHRPLYRKWWFWVLATPLILFIALVIYRIPAVTEKERTQQVVAQIHAQRLTINDVNGEHLPPPPDPALVDATIEGIDANANGIRDDVELAIFKKYPNSARIRSAELQYAMELQKELSSVFNSETLVATIQQEGRGFGCVFDGSGSDSIFDNRKTEVRSLIFNTEMRQKKSDEIFDKYMTSFKTLQGEDCDIAPSSLID